MTPLPYNTFTVPALAVRLYHWHCGAQDWALNPFSKEETSSSAQKEVWPGQFTKMDPG